MILPLQCFRDPTQSFTEIFPTLLGLLGYEAQGVGQLAPHYEPATVFFLTPCLNGAC